MLAYLMLLKRSIYCYQNTSILWLIFNIRVIWKSVKSDFFKTCNGVKQGGVLSTVLFSMYIDPLLVELSKSAYGYHLNGVYTGALSYADDRTISCPSIIVLNRC